MKWFKHDSDANRDAKLMRVRIKYGMEGYGLYWYCLELIAQGVEESNLTCRLEHDAEIIAHDTGIHYERVQEMMQYMVEQGLFQRDADSYIFCRKLLQRLDQSMVSNPKFRKAIKDARENHDGVMTNHDSVMREKNRTEVEETRKDIYAAGAANKTSRKQKIAPDNFTVTAHMMEWARGKGMDQAFIDRHTERFRNHEFNTGKTDWTRTWYNWLDKAQEYENQHKPKLSIVEDNW